MVPIFGRQINVRENFALSSENISFIMKLDHIPHDLKKLDLNYCYWISSKELCTFVKRCKNLRELAVAHSAISNLDLAEILAENKNISKISFRIENPATFWLSNENASASEAFGFNLWAKLFSNTHFGKCREAFARLESIEIYIGQQPIILATLLRYACLIYSTVE